MSGHLGRRILLRAATAVAATAMLPAGLNAGATSPVARHAAPMLQRLPGHEANGPDLAEWSDFKARFLLPDGRIVDTGNGGVSHSEGQGFALLLAEWSNDRAAFDRILGWTLANLRRRDDRLLAWRWKPGVAVAVQDLNNATDGDIFVAWALLRAAARWDMPAWHNEALAMLADMRRRLIVEVGGRLMLLPGAQGFVHRDHVVVNPSYYVFAAFDAFAQVDAPAVWSRLEEDGLALLRAARFGRWALPADWVAVSRDGATLRPATGWPPRFSWDAVRVPLYLAWAGHHAEPSLRAATAFWADARHAQVPAWTDLGSGAVSPHRAPTGTAAVARLASAASAGRTLNAASLATMRVAPAHDYYAAALTLLARVAAREGLREAAV